MKKYIIMLLFALPLSLSAQAIGTKAPDFDLKSLDHGRIKLSDFSGKVVYLFFFGYG